MKLPVMKLSLDLCVPDYVRRRSLMPIGDEGRSQALYLKYQAAPQAQEDKKQRRAQRETERAFSRRRSRADKV
ncbi:hypothetical protein EAH78_31775 [Pseudomonas arsenicoxydans]|uniref:Uncharacterized protein n=1 Tax=Pseudomonas arsenicoxydans TaxID=702115 RepID=A0A502GXJ6_9PSED|nr:hypothetical protein EAH78_31775 [Pseudomonas arsenicoxydans]